LKNASKIHNFFKLVANVFAVGYALLTLLLSREHRRKERMVFPLFLRSADGSNATISGAPKAVSLSFELTRPRNDSK